MNEPLLAPEPQPPKSRIHVIEFTPQRCKLAIARGKLLGSGSMAFVAVWSVLVYSTIYLVPVVFFGEIRELLSLLVALIWIICLYVSVKWIQGHFEKLFILLEHDRLIIRRTFFREERFDVVLLNDSAAAKIAGKLNKPKWARRGAQFYGPSECIVIAGTNGIAVFGASLSRTDLYWLQDQINEFLSAGRELEPSGSCDLCGAPWNGEFVETEADEPVCPKCGEPLIKNELDADDSFDFERLPAESLTIDLHTNDHLRFHLPVCRRHSADGWILIAFFSFGLFFVMGVLAPAARDVPGIHALFWCLSLFMALSVGWRILYSFFGGITVDLTQDHLSVKKHVGPLGSTKRMKTSMIKRITFLYIDKVAEELTESDSDIIDLPEVCAISDGFRRIELDATDDRETNRYIAQLLRRQLATMREQQICS